jgi:hypothetical protein
MLTGAPPHAGSAEMAGRKGRQPPQSPRLFLPDIPEALEGITMAALEWERKRRPQSIAELEAALIGVAENSARAATNSRGERLAPSRATPNQARNRFRDTRDAAMRAIAELAAEGAAAPGPSLRAAPAGTLSAVDLAALAGSEMSSPRPSRPMTAARGSARPSMAPGTVEVSPGGRTRWRAMVVAAGVLVMVAVALFSDTFGCRDQLRAPGTNVVAPGSNQPQLPRP